MNPTKKMENTVEGIKNQESAIETTAEQDAEGAKLEIDKGAENVLTTTTTMVEGVKTKDGASEEDINEATKAGDEATKNITELEKQANEEIAGLNEDKEAKKEFPEGHIMNPQMLDKIAQLEAIDRQPPYAFNQDVYEKFLQDEASKTNNSVTINQKNITEASAEYGEMGMEMAILPSIYGVGGANRYDANQDTGIVTLSSKGNKMNTSGTEEYFEVLKNKARELGLELE